MLRSIINFRRCSLIHIRVFKKSEIELEFEDIAYRAVDFLLRNLSLLHKFLDILYEAI